MLILYLVCKKIGGIEMIEKFKEKVLLKKTASIFMAICIFAIALFFVQMTPQKVYADTTSDGFSYWVSGSHAAISGYQWQGGNTDITIPSTITSNGKTYTVTEISYGAFNYSTKLTSITIPNSVTGIEERAFEGCSGLTKLTIPDSVTGIGDYAFSGCSSLANLIIPENVFSFGYDVFSDCSSLASVTISNGVTSIGYGQFSGCSRLTNVTIPDTITSIDSWAFDGCENLTSITIPNSVTSISNQVFSGCTSLTNMTIPNSVTSIGYSAFEGCTSLTNMTIPSSVTSINYEAFHGCTLLAKVKFLGNAPSMGGSDSVFSECNPNLKVYYLYGNKTFSNPWNWQPTESFYGTIYIGNENTSGTVPVDSNSYLPGDIVTVSGNDGTVTKQGYTFAGWNTAADGSGTDYNSGDEFVFGTDNAMLYAKWNIENYAINFDSQGASEVSSEDADYNSLITLPVTPTKRGYTFGGWYKEARCINVWDFTTDRVTRTTTLYARWTVSVVAPATVTNIKSSSSSYSSANTTWNKVTGANGYDLARATSVNGTYATIARVTSSSYNNGGLATGTNYYYKVRSFKTVGGTRLYSNFWSNIASVKPVPAQVTNVKATRVNTKSIKITWNRVTGASGYEVFKSTSSNGSYAIYARTSNSSFINGSLTKGRTYYYKVRSFRYVGSTKVYCNYWSAIVHARP